MLYLSIILAFVIGFGLAWMVLKSRPQTQHLETLNQLETQVAISEEKLREAQSKAENLLAQVDKLTLQEKDAIRVQSQLESQLQSEREKLSRQEKDLADLQKR